MGHNDYVRPAGKWYDGSTPGQRDLRELDRLSTESLDYVGGGTYTPETPIQIGGAGIDWQTNSDASHLSGGVRTENGGRLVMGQNDYPLLAPARTRDIVMPFGMTSRFSTGAWLLGTVEASRDPFGLIFLETGGGPVLQLPVPGRYLHDGATLSTITMRWRLSSNPGAVPTDTPWLLAMYRIDSSGTATSTLPSPFTTWATGTAYALNRYVSPTLGRVTGFYYKATAILGTGTSQGADTVAWPTVVGNTVIDNPGANQITWTCWGRDGQLARPASADAYYASGAAQSLILDPNQNNVIDRASYRYMLLIGSLTPNIILHSLKFSYTAINDLRPE